MSIITRITANPEASKGRERICVQCGTIYKSKRTTGTFCSTSCRQKSNRGTPARALKVTQWSLITKALQKVGYIGITAQANKRTNTPATYSMTVPTDHAYGELCLELNRRDLRPVCREEFSEGLRMDGIESFYALSPEATAHKLWRDRSAQQLRRQS